jgi:formiminotetrahydrofolate cyclodeaminase
VIHSQIPIATRFTASDLGAAAALAEGAVRAALLTADVNIQLLREAHGGDASAADALERRRDAILQHVVEAARDIENQTRGMINRQSREGGAV